LFEFRMRAFVVCTLVLALSAFVLALDEVETNFLRDSQRKTLCDNLEQACEGGCAGVKCDDAKEHITEINWSEMEMKTILDSFSQLPSIQVFDVSNNAIESLPDGLTFPASLVTLNLAGNKLSALPALNFEAVTSFDCSNNQIKELPEITATKLETLKISNNLIQTLPDSYSHEKLSALTKVELDNNCLDCDKVEELLKDVQVTCSADSQTACDSSSEPSSSEPSSSEPSSSEASSSEHSSSEASSSEHSSSEHSSSESSSSETSSSEPVHSSSEHPKPNPPKPEPPKHSSSSSEVGLSGGAIFLIVLAIMFFIVVILGVLYILYRKGFFARKRATYQTVADPLLTDKDTL